MFLTHKVLKCSFRVDPDRSVVDLGRKIKNIKCCARLGVGPSNRGVDLGKKIQNHKNAMPDFESTLAIEGSTSVGKIETHFLFCAN